MSLSKTLYLLSLVLVEPRKTCPNMAEKLLAEIKQTNKMLVRIANREGPDQTASSEAVLFWSALFVLAFLAGNKCSKF